VTYNPDLVVPFGYSRSYKTLAGLHGWLLVHHHPEYVRRLIAWLSSKNGTIGVGGGWRADGSQPDKPGFAPEGRSFHQNQQYNDGFIGACAVDLVALNGINVHRSPYWREVPAQDSAEAARWGVHCNIGSEPWHMQPVEIDGWLSWMNAGQPAPQNGYPLPDDNPPPPPTDPMTGVAAMGVPLVLRYGGTPTEKWSGYYSFDGVSRQGVRGLHHARQLQALGAIDAKTLQAVEDPVWSDVTHTTNAEELDEWLTPGRD
jgi:hypothetical protein